MGSGLILDANSNRAYEFLFIMHIIHFVKLIALCTGEVH